MPFAKGHKKVGGRQLNSSNKVEAEQKQLSLEALKSAQPPIMDYFTSGQFADDLSKVEDPKERLLIMAKYANYVMPKRQAVDGSIDINTAPTTLDNTLASLSEDSDN